MRFVDNCAAFIIAVLSTVICFVYTGKACLTGKRFMVGLSTRLLSAESNGCGSSGHERSQQGRSCHDLAIGMAHGYGGRRVPQGEGSHTLALGATGQSESLCTVGHEAPHLALSAG
jgi:hypothetical protein